MGRILFDELHAQRGYPAPLAPGHAHVHRHAEALHDVSKRSLRPPRAEQGAEQHVAARPAPAIKVPDAHALPRIPSRRRPR